LEKYNFGADDSYLLKENILQIDNVVDLQKAEQYTFLVRALEVSQGKFQIPSFNLAGLQALHAYLFQDIYTFAGEIRSVQLTKGQTRFCQVLYIASEAERLFAEMQKEGEWPTKEYAALRLAYFKAELNMLHPFREGNGRSIRIFVHAYAQSKGYEWHYEHLQQDTYLRAMIQSVVTSDELQQLFYNTIQKI
jgi:cell filamentation protein